MASTTPDLTAFLAEIMGNNQAIEQDSKVVREIMDERKVTQEKLNTAILGGTDERGETALSIQTSQLGLLEAQNASQRFAAAAGTDITKSNEVMTALGVTLREKGAQAIALKAKVTEKLSRDFGSNPLAWFSGQMTVGDDINLADAVSDEAAAAKDNWLP